MGLLYGRVGMVPKGLWALISLPFPNHMDILIIILIILFLIVPPLARSRARSHTHPRTMLTDPRTHSLFRPLIYTPTYLPYPLPICSLE